MQSTHSTCEHSYVHFVVLCCAVQGVVVLRAAIRAAVRQSGCGMRYRQIDGAVTLLVGRVVVDCMHLWQTITSGSHNDMAFAQATCRDSQLQAS